MPTLGSRTLAAILFVLLLPLMAAIGLLVAVALGRPVLFRQQRSGLNGRTFVMIKFRSMSDSRDETGELLPDGQRLGAIGRWLRRSRLDELPELVNVIRGEMAFIGPRPLLPVTIAEMGAKGRARSAVAPGLTGWAQVNGNTLLSNEEKIDLDLWYVANRSPMLNVKILLRTLWVILGGERRPAVSGPPGSLTGGRR